MSCLRLLGAIVLLLSSSLPTAWSQNGPVRSPTNPINERTELDLEMQRKVQKQQQKKRVEEMKHDSQRLLELATELKHYVDGSGENTLSLEVLRKADEMEKLARQVKKNMRAE